MRQGLPCGVAATAALTVAMLRVRSPLWAGGIGCMVALFPAVMSANTYFAGPTFFSALFLAALSAYLADRFRYGFLIAIVPLTMACGIYSVFIGYAAGLIVMRCIWLLLENERPLKSVFAFGFKGIFLLAASAALYYVILQVALRQAGVALSDYRGIDRLGGQSLATLPAAIAAAYRKVYYFFRYGIFLYYFNSTMEAGFRYLNWATLALCGALSVAVGLKKLRGGGCQFSAFVAHADGSRAGGAVSDGHPCHCRAGQQRRYALDHVLPVCVGIYIHAYGGGSAGNGVRTVGNAIGREQTDSVCGARRHGCGAAGYAAAVAAVVLYDQPEL